MGSKGAGLPAPILPSRRRFGGQAILCYRTSGAGTERTDCRGPQRHARRPGPVKAKPKEKAMSETFAEFETRARGQGYNEVLERRWEPGQVVA